jgi:hypothetical protein
VFWFLDPFVDTVLVPGTVYLDHLWPSEASELYMRALVCGMFMAFGLYAGHLVTRARRAEELKREASLREHQLVRILDGFVPICAGCKKVRNDDDRWAPVEQFIHDRTGDQLTHGLCPECEEDTREGRVASGRPN